MRTGSEFSNVKFDMINCSQKSEIQNLKSKIEAEACLNGMSQGPIPEDVRKDDHIRGPPEGDS